MHPTRPALYLIASTEFGKSVCARDGWWQRRRRHRGKGCEAKPNRPALLRALSRARPIRRGRHASFSTVIHKVNILSNQFDNIFAIGNDERSIMNRKRGDMIARFT